MDRDTLTGQIDRYNEAVGRALANKNCSKAALDVREAEAHLRATLHAMHGTVVCYKGQGYAVTYKPDGQPVLTLFGEVANLDD